MGDTASREVEKVSRASLQRSHKGHGRGVLRRADVIREKRRTIEELLFEVHCPTHKKTCPLCMNNMMVGGWRYDGNRDSWYKTPSATVPEVAIVTLPILSLPSVLFFEFQATCFSRYLGLLTYFPQVCGGTSLGQRAARDNLPHLWLAQVTVRANLDKRVALFGPDDKQSYTSRRIKCLLYCRLQPKSEAQRPHRCHL